MKVLIAGGGTGGHLFPGIALAEEVVTRHHANEVVFVGTERGLEARVVPREGYPLELVKVQGLKGKGFFSLLKALIALPLAFIESFRILARQKPDVVVGVGGYASGPVVLAAWLMGIPTAIQEQNALPGLTNKVLGKVVRVVFIAFEEARQFFPEKKVQLIGNPIRRKLMDNYLRSHVAHEHFSVLVFGGSLGARGLNQRMLEALDSLGDLKGELRFVHQTGKNDLEMVRKGYQDKGFDAEVVEFIDDMSSAYAKADLVICRAGATTLAELTVCKKASILVPFPHATDDHQTVNARALVDAGAALMFQESELTGAKLAETLRTLKEHPERLKGMEKKAALLGRPEAAKELADVCVDLMVQTWGPSGRERATPEAKKAPRSES
ncbi:undecaprenyldiphospho-muramoylpentapeptide beta-N-acetylglucosaminyltransferase [Myxococcus sp. MISCRS1]|uniref:undecaprenyldiphospho-muramoylpentapeptide beta-N-acetylglucosaminyltransferase n=1 Tax=unclassified Myxococcus TaxID=2648731 RepID=UPI001CBC1A9D|nr:undecaprenyldiphospho-muramoylpentapeptide beta-N-acetylglucosaminyltransferase [Myxococcus sp. MISCRS1]MBZ4394796.1 undecaprenyldiphospho-muramoylpentapeptide beta-N-acetylglucosaminyltransferase [Myxococcus sp. AS-1-15]MBZ4410269.1 undecaprenyldiphospho-muramoylpentapeptide beta-N-acetylglucosaminyltransferase [Myxococcus sp. XM-1-1-1]MCY1001767.1 undecaprenyldiphospho-muramoylpentapeptide beta-N-acetylglucosaminyltransferase [Myxococcus sp. MISCRS1]BDT36661.1 undecaprenyldiphospho-muramoy